MSKVQIDRLKISDKVSLSVRNEMVLINIEVAKKIGICKLYG